MHFNNYLYSVTIVIWRSPRIIWTIY